MTKKNSWGSKIPLPPSPHTHTHNFSNGLSLNSTVSYVRGDEWPFKNVESRQI